MTSAELRGCVKVEVAVLDSTSLLILMVSVDVKQHCTRTKELRSCVKVESLIVLNMVSVHVKQQRTELQTVKESQGAV